MDVVLSSELSHTGKNPAEELRAGMPQSIAVIRNQTGKEIAYIFPLHVPRKEETGCLPYGKLVGLGTIDTGIGDKGAPPLIDWEEPPEEEQFARITQDAAQAIQALLVNGKEGFSDFYETLISRPKKAKKLSPLDSYIDLSVVMDEIVSAKERGKEFQSGGQRRQMLRVLQGRWDRSLPLETTFLAADDCSPRLRNEANRLVEAAHEIQEFLKHYPTPEQAFAALTGKEPEGKLQWTIRPYGICFLTSKREDATRFTSLGIFGHGAAMVKCEAMPEMGKYIAVINADPEMRTVENESEQERRERVKSDVVGVEHELLHLRTERLLEANLNERRKAVKDTYGDERFLLLSGSPPLERCEQVYGDVADAYANYNVKHELISYMTSSPERLQHSDIFDSGSYEMPEPYLVYVYTCPPYNKKEDNDLFIAQRKKIGWPEWLDEKNHRWNGVFGSACKSSAGTC
ncbi:MAG: hypothetical protein PHX87_02245 [Candidatus Peribacteraceae bacterium]|nr:hypothetical protein [Candidatus Peribacteraceae bacterium]MDD5742227.1 hypothetical protein [Candidatus Peribacteraceae bacterium]